MMLLIIGLITDCCRKDISDFHTYVQTLIYEKRKGYKATYNK